MSAPTETPGSLPVERLEQDFAREWARVQAENPDLFMGGYVAAGNE